MTKPLTVGIIGCGEITSKRRADQLEAAAGVQLGAAMDINEAVAADIGERYDIPYTTEQHELLAREKIDVVYIATPHHLHAEQAMAAADADKHVFVEKPIAVDIESAKETIAACENAGVTLCVCEPYRYKAPYHTAAEIIEAGHLGDVVGTKISIMARKPESYWEGGYTGRVQTDWRQSHEKSGGGILSINGIHNVDAMRALTGLEPKRVFAEYDTLATPVEVEDFGIVTIRYEGGEIGYIEASSFVQDGPYGEVVRGDRVYGTEGELVLSDPLLVRTNETTELGEGEVWHEVPTNDIRPAGVRLIEAFADAIREGREPPVPGEDGLRALEVIEAAYEAGRCDNPIELPLY
ncbi:Gfo/Idh/MocA family protein [Haladaptatus sp. DFWS20]|uniref:Gfo/Idh/MocA family protein n=1 Tax=Haladaptatus sp. DFWS20 TaxID=3403467 RepID=UPI003EC0CE87